MHLHRRAVESFSLRRSPEDAQMVRVDVRCSKGTYVRSLAADVGERLGTLAHLTGLRREASGRFSVDSAWALEDLVREIAAAGAGKPIDEA